MLPVCIKENPTTEIPKLKKDLAWQFNLIFGFFFSKKVEIELEEQLLMKPSNYFNLWSTLLPKDARVLEYQLE